MVPSGLAPVIIFAYRRKDELQASIEALQKCTLFDKTDVHIFSDGPKGEKDILDVLEVRDYIKTLSGCLNLTYYFSDQNKGLGNSIISGVSSIFRKYSTIIVLEDDLIPSSNFLEYMNQALAFYKNNPEVFSISGYAYDFKIKNNEVNDIYFLPRPCSTGWGTWKGRWESINWDVRDFGELAKNPQKIRAFNKGGSDLYKMLCRQMSGKIDSWAIRWAYNQFKSNSVTAYPVVSKIKNIGFNNKSTNTNIYNKYASSFDEGDQHVFNFPKTVTVDPFYHKQLLSFFSLKNRGKNRLLTYLLKLRLINKK